MAAQKRQEGYNKSISLGREPMCSENFHVPIQGVEHEATYGGVPAPRNTPSELHGGHLDPLSRDGLALGERRDMSQNQKRDERK